jgi:hypothetical protein
MPTPFQAVLRTLVPSKSRKIVRRALGLLCSRKVCGSGATARAVEVLRTRESGAGST